MGPMRAAHRFVQEAAERGLVERAERVRADLYGSLALTGVGHATDRAVLLGLSGNEPATIDPSSMDATLAEIRASGKLLLNGSRPISFAQERDLIFHREEMFPPGSRMQHPNGLRLALLDGNGSVLEERTFFSIGGGFVVEDLAAAEDSKKGGSAGSSAEAVPYPFHSAAELLRQCAENHLSISDLMMRNECAVVAEREGLGELVAVEKVRAGIDRIWQTMRACIERGIATEGILPGGLNVQRRAHRLAERLHAKETEGKASDPLAPRDWVTVYAMAGNEENAAGGRVVTAPTNGAAGVVPAVARYYERYTAGADREGMHRFFLVSAAIGILYKENASISGAEVGCQGEVGVACSMAAAGLTAALGGSNGQIEHAAEIGMEHNLGMTCDPIGGLVQIPCIERNAMGAVKAVQASRIAMNESEAHKVSLDQVIRTMYLTGLDMQSRYKETSLAGLALNIIEC